MSAGDVVGIIVSTTASIACALAVLALIVLLTGGIMPAWLWLAVPVAAVLSIFNGYIATDLLEGALRGDDA